MELVRKFSQISKNDANIAGGKGASLGEMTRAGIPVPEGFVVLAGVFERFIEDGAMAFPVTSAEDIVKEPHLAGKGFWQEIEHPELGEKLLYPVVRFFTVLVQNSAMSFQASLLNSFVLSRTLSTSFRRFWKCQLSVCRTTFWGRRSSQR